MADKPKELTPEELAKLKPSDVVPVQASAFQLQSTGVDFQLMFQRIRPLTDEKGALHAGVAMAELVAIIGMSPQALKDLSILINNQMKQFEADFGKIETPYTREREQAAKNK
jgi:hypothetical protein